MIAFRTFFVLFLAAGFTFVVDAVVFDEGWPDHSGGQWVVFVAGLVVIGIAFVIAETVVERRKRAREAEHEPEGV